MKDRNEQEPLYIQIKNDILNKIANDTIKIGDKLMSENEMMQYYNVGRVTIRNALSTLTAMGCLKKEQGLGTFCIAKPNLSKRKNIDVLLDCNDTYLATSLLAGITRVLEQEDCDLLLHDTKNTVDNTDRLLKNILQRGTDGVILKYPNQQTVSQSSVEILQLFEQLNIPVACVCGSLPHTCANLKIDDRYGAKIAAQYLLDCGHRRILGLFPDVDYGVDERYNSIRNIIDHYPNTMFHAIRTQHIAQDADEIVRTSLRQRVSAVICYNDFYAVQCMHILQESGCRIPEDISIIGFDDSTLSTSAVPQLTTISHPKDHMGSDAARTLLQKIQGSLTGNSRTIYRPELVIRQSVMDISEDHS